MRAEVRRNIWYSVVSRCEDNAKDHAHDYQLLYKRSIWTYLRLKNVAILLALVLAGLAAYGVYLRATDRDRPRITQSY